MNMLIRSPPPISLDNDFAKTPSFHYGRFLVAVITRNVTVSFGH